MHLVWKTRWVSLHTQHTWQSSICLFINMYSLHLGLQWLLSFVHWSPCRSGRAWPIHSTIPALYLAFTQECAPIFPSNWWAYQRAWTLEAQGKTLPNPHLFSHSIYSMFSSHSMMEGLLATSSTQLTVTLPFSWPPSRWTFHGFSSFFKFSSRMGKLCISKMAQCMSDLADHECLSPSNTWACFHVL